MTEEPKTPIPPPAAEGAAPPKAPAPAPAKPVVPAPTPWVSPLSASYLERFPGLVEALTFAGQNYFSVDGSVIAEMLRRLRDEEKFDYCVDITAVHYPKREKPFDVVWILYSFTRNERICVKTQIGEDATVPSVVLIWPTADWLEREVYDMFGIRFAGHPNLKRILLPDDWTGHPLRKDYGIRQQDKKWVQINLGVESAQ